MMPNVRKGGDMPGLLRYLVGPGRERDGGDVHVSPHVVSGDAYLVAWHGNEVLDHAAGSEISDYLEAPRVMYGTQIRTRVKERDPETGEARVTGYRDEHVWHCSLSLRAEDGPLDEESWDRVARDFMDKMGFTEAGGRAPCRWVAIHHGPSKGGNDHIHIAASMVREDGTRWEGRYLDFKRAQEACRELEETHKLTPVAGRSAELSERGEKPAERRHAEAAGLPSTAPKELAARLRAAAVASTSEAEWIRRSRAAGVVVKPFFAKGSTDVVRGYRAALKPEEYSGRLVFYSGGKLGRDLSLPRLREGWPAPDVDQADAAAKEWDAAFRGRPPTQQEGRERLPLDGLAPGASGVAANNFAGFNDRLRDVPVGDRAAWADAARDASGVLSAWARLDPDHAHELRAASQALSRSAQLRRAPLPPGRRVKESPMGTALILMAAKPGKDRHKVAGAVFLRQVIKTAEAVRDHHRAGQRLAEAQRVHRDVVERLHRIQLIGYGTGEDLGPRTATPTKTPAPAMGTNSAARSPLPNRLPPAADRTRPASPLGGRQQKEEGRDYGR